MVRATGSISRTARGCRRGVYPALRRLESLGYVRSKLGKREDRPPRAAAGPALLRNHEVGSQALDDALKRFEALGRLRPRTRHA